MIVYVYVLVNKEDYKKKIILDRFAALDLIIKSLQLP